MPPGARLLLVGSRARCAPGLVLPRCDRVGATTRLRAPAFPWPLGGREHRHRGVAPPSGALPLRPSAPGVRAPRSDVARLRGELLHVSPGRSLAAPKAPAPLGKAPAAARTPPERGPSRPESRWY